MHYLNMYNDGTNKRTQI